MKLLLLVVSFISTLSMAAQTISLKEAEAYAEQLVKKDVLNNKGKETLLKEIRGKSIEIEHPSTVKAVTYTEDELSKETILKFCASAFRAEQISRMKKGDNLIERKIKQEDSLIERTFQLNLNYIMGAKNEGCISLKRSTIGLTRTRTLIDFKDVGLISDAVYHECEKALLDEAVKDEVELLDLMLNRSVYYRFYDFNLSEQKEYISRLVESGILTKEGAASLQASYKPFKLKTRQEILSYSSRYEWVDLTGIEEKPESTFPVIFQSIQKLIPEFRYEDLKAEISEKKESDLIRQDLTLSFRIGDNHYTQRFFYNYRKQIPDSPDVKGPLNRFGEDFHKGVNKYLTDIESPYRLYVVKMVDEVQMVYNPNEVGLLLLKEGEARIISEDYELLSSETFDNRLSKRNLNMLIQTFEEQGFFTHLTTQEIKASKDKLALGDIGSIEDALLAFPNTIVLFVWETGNLENPYEELTKGFAKVSRGAFTPTKVVDEYKKGWSKAKRVKYSFDFKGKHYEAMLPFEEDWLAPQFMELIKKALKDSKVDGGFYYCLDNGQEGGYIFLTSQQYKFIKEKYPDLLKED